MFTLGIATHENTVHGVHLAKNFLSYTETKKKHHLCVLWF